MYIYLQGSKRYLPVYKGQLLIKDIFSDSLECPLYHGVNQWGDRRDIG
jgi:hypothetical protein